ncbi:ABC transporter ATP-binding protein [Herbaspirillum sp. BH-1]|uniref:Branched-chain amino acid transport system ATP-binding protein n=1 Tax=Herbaspirillum frisingense TaxID=92645 RepID=A0ABU1PHS8_9BURK|nr:MULTISPECIES: ABC transporter ATP-binding protein [Herbaspirillum]MDR6584908.1 branched-chain amino acid transport system ATP-binding protein [Herbaspirillum frisingense]PLY60764.1 ABC transporter ATP-binding protein [Herbaspirillum sp. BH-1]
MAEQLSIRGLQASYGRAQALFDISLDLQRGEVITLLGRNGMGRSTTVKCLFGLLRPSAGSISFGGQRIDTLPCHEVACRGLGLVPEGRQIFADLTVEENLIATARPARAGQADSRPWTLRRAYEFFPRLAERRQNMGSQLSGGEQQMLAISRALMTNPSLLVLDEATEGLAPVARADIWRALHELKKEGLSMIVIDKNIQSLMGLADRHYVVEKGRIAWSGSSQQLQQDPSLVHRYMGV